MVNILHGINLKIITEEIEYVKERTVDILKELKMMICLVSR